MDQILIDGFPPGSIIISADLWLICLQEINRQSQKYSKEYQQQYIDPQNNMGCLFFSSLDRFDDTYDESQIPHQLRRLFKDFIKFTQQRKVEVQFLDYVGNRLPIEEYIKQYKQPKANLFNQQFQRAQVTGYQRVRGDGNCFYTTVGFQLMLYLKREQIKEYIQRMNLRALKLDAERQYDEDEQNFIKQYLIMKFESEDQLINLFKAKETIFYICFQVFMRNFVMDTLDWFKQTENEQAQFLDFFDTSIIMEFEKESPDLTEIILCALAQRHKLIIQMVTDATIQNYGDEGVQIRILFNTGHYEILH